MHPSKYKNHSIPSFVETRHGKIKKKDILGQFNGVGAQFERPNLDKFSQIANLLSHAHKITLG